VFSFQIPIGPPSYSITTTLDTSEPPGSRGVTTATGLQTPRLTRNGVATSCGVPKAAPALFGAGTIQFDAYAFNTCSNSVPSCVTVTLQGTNAINLFSAAYSPTFVSNNLQQNYMGDAGASGSSKTYSFNLAGGAQTFVVDVHEVDSGLGIGTQYTLNVAGACGGACAPNHVPVAIARDVTVPADASGTANASIDNGSSDADGDPLTITQSPAGPYPIGLTTVLLTVSDPQGATSQATARVTVVGPTTTIVSASPNPSVVAQPVAFTATVTTRSGGFPTDGSVTFREGSTVLAGPTSLFGGQASFSTSSLSVGAHTITAFYSSWSDVFFASNGSIVVLITTSTAPSITLDAAEGTAGGTVTATIANGPGTPGDWAGLFDANGTPVQWLYLNGTHTLPAGGLKFATVTFTLPATPGTYQARLFNATYTLVATSGPITTSAPSVAIGATTGTAGGTVTATIANAPGTPGDWVGLYDANGNPVQWQYLNGSHSLPAVGVSGATVTFALPAPGIYQVRLFNGTYALVAVSETIAVF